MIILFAILGLLALLQFAVARGNVPPGVKVLPVLLAAGATAIGYLTDDLAFFLYGGMALVGLSLGVMVAGACSGKK